MRGKTEKDGHSSPSSFWNPGEGTEMSDAAMDPEAESGKDGGVSPMR